MSLEMSNDPETSNPFEKLSDDPILHIFSFLPGADLLKLATVDKNFNRIITESSETMSKIPLVLKLNNPNLDMDFAIKLAQTRRFTALRLIAVFNLADAIHKVKLGLLLGLLTRYVDDLIVCGKLSRELLSTIIAVFLPKLKKCKLFSVRFEPEASPIMQEISSRSNVNHSLESLKLIKTLDSEILRFFAGCNQLKEFCYEWIYKVAAGDIDQVNNFLATQDRLEKLTFENGGIAWNRLSCFKLRELTAECLRGTDDKLAAAKFLKKLPNLAKLDITFRDHISHPIMKEICRAPKLEKLSIRCCYDEAEHENSLDLLVNHTVKELHIGDYTGITAKLLKIFHGVDRVYLRVRKGDPDENVLDLSDVPYETIGKIKYVRSQDFDVTFSPSDISANVEQFESAVMKFATEFSTRIIGIKIGHETWRNNGAFRLSNSFCENLVNQLPKLVKLEVFNIADSGNFISFLNENQARLHLEDVKLHKPFEAGEPKSKKMKIQVD